MKPSRPSWIARLVVLVVLGTGCIDATTVFVVPPDMPATGDDGGGDGGAPDSDASPSDDVSFAEGSASPD